MPTSARTFRRPASSPTSDSIVVRRDAAGALALTRQPVRFTRVRPGETLIDEAAA